MNGVERANHCAKSKSGTGSFHRRSSLSAMPNRLATYSGEAKVDLLPTIG